MSSAEWRRVSLPDADLEVKIRGSGEPVVLIQTALTADEFLPVARQPEIRDNFQVLLYHRRGYAGSSPVRGPGCSPRSHDGDTRAPGSCRESPVDGRRARTRQPSKQSESAQPAHQNRGS